MNKPLATLTSTNHKGIARRCHDVAVGDYIWHLGAFRRVTATSLNTLRMGRHVLHPGIYSVEAAW